jgi:hypothetical protein
MSSATWPRPSPVTDLSSWNNTPTRAAIQKPVRIWSRVGRRPSVGGGNSNAEDALAQGFTAISVKDDWATVFA